ncbi:hypothetical protein HELRODRAFT_83478 [Helobdella robusta]|uniref:Protein Wnt n=1 Tax=Helobdella robusta TaxID=6412 RepID=T1G560_HELRO|nr:hypothetical protein HELRODRAFT_83478 [Helobdella robusta]ESO00037.1 hypothetical protein HELRODRAFT_83478 [Helobdella robusta]
MLCRSIIGRLSPAHHYFCLRHHDVTEVAILGLRIALSECRYQFKNELWDCTNVMYHRALGKQISDPKKGFKESSVIFALLGASVSTQISRACSAGDLQYSLKKMAIVRCKCHGVSGSCQLKTCWKVAPDFRRVADVIKTKFKMAVRVGAFATNTIEYKIKNLSPKKFKDSLIYTQNSPNFCNPEPKLKILGTTGRQCNASSLDDNDCGSICCGRGFDIVVKTIVKKCLCKFKWCCAVVCRKCFVRRWVAICK